MNTKVKKLDNPLSVKTSQSLTQKAKLKKDHMMHKEKELTLEDMLANMTPENRH